MHGNMKCICYLGGGGSFLRLSLPAFLPSGILFFLPKIRGGGWALRAPPQDPPIGKNRSEGVFDSAYSMNNLRRQNLEQVYNEQNLATL